MKAAILDKLFDRDPSDNKYLFLMVIIAIAIIIPPLVGFMVIASSQSTKVSALVPPLASPAPSPGTCGNQCTNLTVSWTRPSAVAQFVDSGGKKASCSSAGLSCQTIANTYWPGSDIIYSVKVNNSSGAVLKSGGTKASSTGRASANWNWKYEIAVYPSVYKDCLSAGVYNECLTKVVTNDNSNNSVTYDNVKYATEYSIYVCAPNCGQGTVILQKKQTTPPLPTQPTPTPPVGFPFVLAPASVSGTTATFSITPPTGSGSILFIKDLSTSIPIPSGATSIAWTGPAGTHQAVISAFGVDVSNTVSFTLRIASCTYDFNNDGKIDNADNQILLSHFGAAAPAGSDLAKYDLNADGYIDLQDSLILTSKFGSCFTVPVVPPGQ